MTEREEMYEVDEVDELADDEEVDEADEVDEVGFDLQEWDADLRVLVARALDVEGVPYQWEGDGELVVRAADAERVETILDELAESEELDDEADADAGVSYEALSDLFVGADRLMHAPWDVKRSEELMRCARAVEASAPPFGLAGEDWARIRGLAAKIRRDVADGVDDDVLADDARRLRDALRPYV